MVYQYARLPIVQGYMRKTQSSMDELRGLAENVLYMLLMFEYSELELAYGASV
jgi:hypothetical protein